MLKKLILFALILNTLPVMASNSSAKPSYDVAVICTVAGTICAWLAYKDFKKGWQAYKEFDHHLKILNEMGIKVYKVENLEFEWDSLVTYESYRMDIPSDFSQQQEKKAKEHFNLLVTSAKDRNKMLGYPLIGSLLLIPTGIWEFLK